VPFLVIAFVVLYVWPGDTGRLFAWPIRPTMSAMVLGAVYLGGAYFFVLAARASQWHTIKAGFLPVCTFATLMGVATVLHWDRFSHGHVAFWLWAGLYFTAPFLVLAVWVVNQRVAAPPRPDELRIGRVARVVVAAGSGLALVQGLVMFAVPSVVVPVWPWQLTPLTARVVGAVFCLGSAGLVVLRDTRWVRLRLMVEVEMVMLTLMLVGMVRARTDLYPDRPLTWLLLGGFVATLAASLWIWRAMATRAEGD
jgi:hypothetical protein